MRPDRHQVLRERERERERALLGIFHNGGSRASPAHGLRITILTGLLDRIVLHPSLGCWLSPVASHSSNVIWANTNLNPPTRRKFELYVVDKVDVYPTFNKSSTFRVHVHVSPTIDIQ